YNLPSRCHLLTHSLKALGALHRHQHETCRWSIGRDTNQRNSHSARLVTMVGGRSEASMLLGENPAPSGWDGVGTPHLITVEWPPPCRCPMECHSPSAIKNESAEILPKIFPEFGHEFDHLFRGDLADHLLGVTPCDFDNDLVDTGIVAK